jgi:hypothetical protein
MSLKESLLSRSRTIGWLGHFIVAACVAAAFNFAQIYSQTMKAANAAGTHIVDGYEITVCYFGPPAAFYPRLLVFGALLVASVGVLRPAFPRSLITLVGLTGALSAYIYWWMASYRIFRNLSHADIHFLNNTEIKQTAYLYQGTWLDVCVAISIVVCLVLLLDRLLKRQRLAVS